MNYKNLIKNEYIIQRNGKPNLFKFYKTKKQTMIKNKIGYKKLIMYINIIQKKETHES